MNQTIIIGNLTCDPQTRMTQTGKSVCSFTVAVNGRNDQTTFFRVSAWEKLAELCQQYLAKGRKVCVTGTVSANAYTTNGGENRASLELMAREAEFLSPREENSAQPARMPENGGFVQVDDEQLPF